MNATVAIAAAFLRGEVLTIKTAFKDFGISNLPRECGRAIERKFGVSLVRVRREGNTRYKVPCSWYEYRLALTDYNAEGREKMIEYVVKNGGEHLISTKPKPIKPTKQESTIFSQSKMFDA